MKKYFCPQHIKDLFASATDEHVDGPAYEAYFAWVESLPVNKGDLVESYAFDGGRWGWVEYQPEQRMH